jgi:transposase-like protein
MVDATETKEVWNVFFADPVARGLPDVRLVTSNAHAGLVGAIGATSPRRGAAALIRQHERRRDGPAGPSSAPGEDLAG